MVVSADVHACRTQGKVGGDAVGTRVLGRGTATVGEVEQRTDLIDPGGPGVGGLDQARVHVDHQGPVGGDDHVGGQRAVPAERGAEPLDDLPGLG